MTREEALRLINLIPQESFTRETGMGRACYPDYVVRLKQSFPEFNWRIILDRSGHRTRWILTIDDNDPREHYVPVKGKCICCGKSAMELRAAGVPVTEREDDDD